MKNYSDFTPVPDRFIDSCMEYATRTQIIVYLYLLRLRASGKKYSVEDVAQDLHLTNDDVEKALSYWSEQGMLAPDSAKPSSDPDRNARSQLLMRVEQYAGKPLSVQEMQTVYYIREDLHFSDDLTDYLFRYYTDQGRRNFQYIEKKAVEWAQAGISNCRQASLYVSSSGRGGRRRRGESTSANRFNHFEQHDYDFDALERELLETPDK